MGCLPEEPGRAQMSGDGNDPAVELGAVLREVMDRLDRINARLSAGGGWSAGQETAISPGNEARRQGVAG